MESPSRVINPAAPANAFFSQGHYDHVAGENPSNFPEHRFGPLRFVYRRRGPSLLVVDGVRVNKSGRVGRRAKGGAFTKTGRIKQGMATAVMFVMVPQARIRKRLDVRREATRWEKRLPGLIGRQMPIRE